MFSLTLVSLLSALLANVQVHASPCVTFDADFNLLAFGLQGKDYNAGTQDTWGSNNKASDITASGRPPFDGSNTTCYLSQFNNAIYTIGADSQNAQAVYIYDVSGKSWSKQSVDQGKFDVTSYDAILDHDTNVFYTLSKGELLFLDMSKSLKAATSDSLSWTDVGKAPYPDGYNPVMALAQNHIHFLGVPNVPAGSADIFVIHFSFFQPDAQKYGDFPDSHGQATSFFQKEGVQQEFAFIPDDGSSTYVINVETNTTQTLAGPSKKDSAATYAAGVTSLVQLDSTGAVAFLPYNQNDTNANKAASWSSVGPLAAAAPPSSTTSGSPSGTSSGKGSSSTSGSNGAAGVRVAGGLGAAAVLGALAMLL